MRREEIGRGGGRTMWFRPTNSPQHLDPKCHSILVRYQTLGERRRGGEQRRPGIEKRRLDLGGARISGGLSEVMMCWKRTQRAAISICVSLCKYSYFLDFQPPLGSGGVCGWVWTEHEPLCVVHVPTWQVVHHRFDLDGTPLVARQAMRNTDRDTRFPTTHWPMRLKLEAEGVRDLLEKITIFLEDVTPLLRFVFVSSRD